MKISFSLFTNIIIIMKRNISIVCIIIVFYCMRWCRRMQRWRRWWKSRWRRWWILLAMIWKNYFLPRIVLTITIINMKSHIWSCVMIVKNYFFPRIVLTITMINMKSHIWSKHRTHLFVDFKNICHIQYQSIGFIGDSSHISILWILRLPQWTIWPQSGHSTFTSPLVISLISSVSLST